MADEEITRGILNASTLAEVFEDLEQIDQAWAHLNIPPACLEAKGQLQSVVQDFDSDFLVDPLCGGLGSDPIRVSKDMNEQEASTFATALASHKRQVVQAFGSRTPWNIAYQDFLPQYRFSAMRLVTELMVLLMK